MLTYQQALDMCAAAGIVVRPNDEIPALAMVTLEDGTYTIYVRSDLAGEPDGFRAEVICHELSHVLRGDCLTAKRTPEGVDEDRWRMAVNLASDGLINEHLPLIRSNPRYITMDRLRSCYPGIGNGYQETSWLARRILPNLVEHKTEWDVVPALGDDDANVVGHVAAVERLRRLFDGAPPIWVPKEGMWDSCKSGTITVSPEAVELFHLVSLIVRIASRTRRVRRPRGVAAYSRTWRRTRNGLPLYMPFPAVRVVLAVDISASMSDYWGRILYTIRYLCHRVEVQVLAWSDTAEWFDVRCGRQPDWGGGTVLMSALAKLVAGPLPDLLVIITDGEIYDLHRALPVLDNLGLPVVWCLVPGSRPAELEGRMVVEWTWRIGVQRC